jgi:uncharacterized protein with PIN domain
MNPYDVQEGMRFLADNMLGKLARWLRIMGYDTAYAQNEEDAELVARAEAESRILLTRDRELARRKGPQSLFIESILLDEQLRQVIEKFQLSVMEELRCTECNGVLVGVQATTLKGKIEQSVLERQNEFYMCNDCGKIYWKGTHWIHIEERLKGLMQVLR